MSKKRIILICILATVLFLIGIAAAVYAVYHDQLTDVISALNITSKTNVEWAVDPKLPETLPVYEVGSADNLEYIWHNVLSYCGFENLEYKKGAKFSNAKWSILVENDTGEIRVWSNEHNSSDEKNDIPSSIEMKERAEELMKHLGLQPENYCLAGRIYGDAEGFTYTYLVDDKYRWDMHMSEAFSVSFEGYALSDFSLFLRDIKENGYVNTVALEAIRDSIRDILFYTYAEEVGNRRIDNLKIINVEIIYEADNGELLPRYEIEAEINLGGISTWSAFACTDAHTDHIYTKNKESVKQDIDTTELTYREISEFYHSGKSAFDSRDFQRASFILYDVYFEIHNKVNVSPELQWVKNKAQLYAVLADLNLGKTSEILNPLLRCDEYFEVAAAGDEYSYIDGNELHTARVYTKLALTHRFIELHEYEDAGKYLNRVKNLLEEKPGNKYQEVFYAFEMTYLSSKEADDLLECIAEWREMCYGEASKPYLYYAPLMKVMAAKAYCEIGEYEKARELFEKDLLAQGVHNETEEMRLKAEIYTAYADYLNSSGTGDDEMILRYLCDSAALYNALRISCDDGVIIDGTYFKQSGISYYNLAVYYAEKALPVTALEYLENSFEYLTPFINETGEILAEALKLGADLYELIGNMEKAQEYTEKLKQHLEIFPYSAGSMIENEYVSTELEEFDGNIAIINMRDTSNTAGLPIYLTQLEITQKGIENPGLIQAVETLNQKIDSILTEYSHGLTVNYLHCLANGYLTMHEVTSNLSVVRADEKVISVLLDVSWYTNGPHEILIHHAINYSIDEGRIISEADLIKPGMLEEVNTMLHQKYPQTIIFDIREGSDNNYEVILAPDGILFVFSLGQAGAYVDGTLTLLYLYGDTSEFKRTSYVKTPFVC